jgi:hypothetical protein
MGNDNGASVRLSRFQNHRFHEAHLVADFLAVGFDVAETRVIAQAGRALGDFREADGFGDAKTGQL